MQYQPGPASFHSRFVRLVAVSGRCRILAFYFRCEYPQRNVSPGDAGNRRDFEFGGLALLLAHTQEMRRVGDESRHHFDILPADRNAV